jgi:hypothetical protein
VVLTIAPDINLAELEAGQLGRVRPANLKRHPYNISRALRSHPSKTNAPAALGSTGRQP